jgi:hypothetical protein
VRTVIAAELTHSPEAATRKPPRYGGPEVVEHYE